tara:strand:- start:1610 stop:1867 length:258 start_codon:yes stop_codon:yes gene_type:complete
VIKNIIAVLLLTLPSLALADYMDGFYMAIKGGVSNTRNTGLTTFVTSRTLVEDTLSSSSLGKGHVGGFSAGKYVTDNFRLELEAT